jgi:hypothetical protein
MFDVYRFIQKIIRSEISCGPAAVSVTLNLKKAQLQEVLRRNNSPRVSCNACTLTALIKLFKFRNRFRDIINLEKIYNPLIPKIN